MSLVESLGLPAPEFEEQSTREGAQRLCTKINDFWAARGIRANARPIMEGFSPAMRQHFYSIKSDLKNGLPRQERQP